MNLSHLHAVPSCASTNTDDAHKVGAFTERKSTAVFAGCTALSAFWDVFDAVVGDFLDRHPDNREAARLSCATETIIAHWRRDNSGTRPRGGNFVAMLVNDPVSLALFYSKLPGSELAQISPAELAAFLQFKKAMRAEVIATDVDARLKEARV